MADNKLEIDIVTIGLKACSRLIVVDTKKVEQRFAKPVLKFSVQ